MEHIVVGMNHHTAPVEIREKVAISSTGLRSALKDLLSLDEVKEGLILSTCNRTEIYAVTRDVKDSIKNIKKFVAHLNEINPEALDPYFYDYRDLDAIRHVFRVASSLDSMVVGEAQIVGQVKEAFRQAVASKTTGVFLNRLMHRVFYVAKKVRTETTISSKTVSVGSAGVELAKRIFGNLSSKKVALIGAGKIGELVLAYLEDEGVFDVAVLNRTLQKAYDLAQDGIGVAYSMERLKDVLKDVDIVISSISTDSPVVSQKDVTTLMSERKNRPMFFIDLGVPRNIDPHVNKVENIYLYNIDDLKKVIDSNMQLRKAEAKKAEEIIEKEASQFYETVVRQEPTIASLAKKFDYIRKRELDKTLKRLRQFSAEEKMAIEKCTEAIVNKILHDPILMLKTEGRFKRDSGIHELVKKLFRLDDE